MVLSQFNIRFKPKLRLPASCVDMHMHSSLFAGKEVEAKRTFTEDFGFTKGILPVHFAAQLGAV